MQDKDPIDRGRQAEIELPIASERFEVLRNDIYKLLEACGHKDDTERRNLCQALQISTKVLEYLMIPINEAKLAKDKLEEIRKVGKQSVLERILP